MLLTRLHQNRNAHIFFGILILCLLCLTRFYNYLLFHSLSEIFSIIVAFGIFMLSWHSRRFVEDDFFIVLGIVYLHVGAIDLVHTLAYKGMHVFPGFETNLATQLWISARYVESLSFLWISTRIGRKFPVAKIFIGYTVAVALIFISIFVWHIFPDCFVEGAGLTPFKKISEYIISACFAGAVVGVVNKRQEFEKTVLRLIILSLVISIASELAFTMYKHAYAFWNMVGHILKVISFYCIYRAIIVTGLERPFSLLFRSLKKSEEKLRAARDDLENRVRERTAELVKINEALQAEISERLHYQLRLRSLASELTLAEERERRRIATELHDRIVQMLAVIKIRMGDLRESHSEKRFAEPLQSVYDLIDQTIQDTRSLTFELSPPILYELGFVDAVEWLAEKFQKKNGILADVEDDGLDKSLEDDVRIVLFQTLRELLTNVSKHAEAHHVNIRMFRHTNQIGIELEDDGIGFDVSEIQVKPETSTGFGLFNIKERMEYIGGHCHITSRKKQGIKVTLTAPLSQKIQK